MRGPARRVDRRRPPDSLSLALAFGVVLAALVGALDPVSGVHLNPAVTIGLAVTRKFPWTSVPTHVGFQLVGAMLSACATWATPGDIARQKANLGATYPAAGITDGRALVVEALITFLLVFVIIAVVSDDRVHSATASTSIEFALIAAVSLDFTSFWVQLVGPIIGGIAAAVLYDTVVAPASEPDPDDDESVNSA